jgi:hypothetical protein
MKKPNFRWTAKYYEWFLLAGAFFTGLSIFVYNYFYIVSSDDLAGLIAACCLFLGCVVLGEGLRAWKEVKGYMGQFVHMTSRKGMDVTIRKRGKQKW